MDALPKPAPAPAPEATSPRRIFSPDDKLRILREAQYCTEPGQLSAFLRKEGIYSSSLSQWRRLHDALGDDAFLPKKAGRKPNLNLEVELARLQADNLRLQERLRKAEFIIDVQKKVAELLSDGPTNPPNASR